MGLTLPALPGAGLPFDTPTPEGRILTSAFRDAIADTIYYREYFDNDAAQVPGEVVLEYIQGVGKVISDGGRGHSDTPVMSR
jgi:hypothetical protein